MKWQPWPEAHTEELREHKAGNTFLESDAEAGECWRSAVKCLFRSDVERTGL